MTVLIIAKQTYMSGLSEWQQDEWIPAADFYILKASKGALTGLSHIYLGVVAKTTLLSQGYALGADSGSKKGKQNVHSQDGGGDGGQ